jgi:regulator of protease activity HflC (stomatin/prohibitin superfamily)
VPAETDAEPADELADGRLAASLEAVKRRAVRELSDRLGPDAEVMAVRIEQCRTPDELRQRLHEAERLVAGILGEAQGQDFLRALRRR